LLQETAFQLSVVDSVAKNSILLEKYRHVFKSLLKLNRERNELLELQSKSQAELDYLNFLFDELEKARLVEGEQTEAEKEAEILTHAAEIKTRLFAAAEILLNSEVNVLKMLAETNTHLSSASRFMPDAATLSDRLRESILEIRDIAESADRLAEATSDDPERLEQLNSRLSLLYQLEQKHRVNSVEELIEVRNSIEHKISSVTSLADQLAETDNRIHELESEREILASELTAGRQAVIPFIEEQVSEIITRLGMKDARFKVNLETSSFTLNGKDEIEFLFSANKGAPLNEISKVASGGELSRLMLAVKSVISTKNLLPTIIFDEIDTGISGDIASRVGEILKSVSKNMQVIAITHLPQIAGKGSEHFKVFKFEESDKTFSALQRLDGAERVDELALMISGDAALEAARETAKELLRNN
jgi:DNA repair protein RecN (Recombination protein N)